VISPSFLRGADSRSRVWPANTSQPYLSLSLLSPFSHSTRLQPDRLLTEIDSQLSSTVTATASLSHHVVVPRLQAHAWRLGTGLRVNEQHLESSPTEGAPVAEGEPEEAIGIGDPRRTTETETRTSWETARTCTLPVCKFPATFG